MPSSPRLEAEHAERTQEIKLKRQALPWVAVEKEYMFDTQDGKKTLAELFDGRSQLLAYNVMFGPDYTLGACPGCTSLADGLDGTLVHLNHMRRDADLLLAGADRATDRLQGADGLAVPVRLHLRDRLPGRLRPHADRGAGAARVRDQGADREPAGWLEEWSGQVGAELKDGLRENPSWIAFARENGTVYHTYTVSAPDPFVAPYFSFLARADAEGASPPEHGPVGRTSTRTNRFAQGQMGGVGDDGWAAGRAGPRVALRRCASRARAR